MSRGLCLFAFDTLYALLSKAKPLALSTILQTVGESIESFPSSAPLFITWDKDNDLRGCIGTFSAQPIEKGVKRFALTAAFEDYRFSPITIKEIDLLSCSVTLLDKFTPIDNPTNWQVGKHGLRLTFQYNGKYYSGTFLPVVAEEQGWDHVTTLWHLLRKSDFNKVSKADSVEFYEKGLTDGWLHLETYEGLKHELTYDDYKKFKDNLV